MSDIQREVKKEKYFRRERILLYIAELLEKEDLITESEKIEMIKIIESKKDFHCSF